MAHVKWLGVQGTLTEAITSESTVIESDGLVDLPAISDPDTAYIVLDPNGESGRPELVVVTGHEDLATPDTFATVIRGQHTEHGGSPARSHAAGTAWYHAASPKDFRQVAANATQRESLDVDDGAIVWQEDTEKHWVYVDGATPYWKLLNTYHQFVYNSSGAQHGNRYNDWADLMEAVDDEEGTKYIIFEQSEVIPPGTYNFDYFVLVGNAADIGSGGYVITFDQNVTISSWIKPVIDGLRVLSTDNTSAICVMDVAQQINIINNGSLKATTGPFFEFTGVGSGSQVVIKLDISGKIPVGTAPVVHISATAFDITLIVYRSTGAYIENNSLTSDNALVFLDIVGSASVDAVTNYPGTHSGLNIGVLLERLFPESTSVKFVPAGSLSSTTVGEALLELDTDITSHISDTVDAHDASSISFNSGATPGTSLAATNVQAAIEELESDLNAYLNSGDYIPTMTNLANTDSITPGLATWMQIGDIVHVSGVCDVDHTTISAVTLVDASLPVASNIALSSDLSGVATTQGAVGAVFGDNSGYQARLAWFAPSAGSTTVFYTYSYRVL